MAQPQLVRNSAILQTGEICSFMVKKKVVLSIVVVHHYQIVKVVLVEANLLITRF